MIGKEKWKKKLNISEEAPNKSKKVAVHNCSTYFFSFFVTHNNSVIEIWHYTLLSID